MGRVQMPDDLFNTTTRQQAKRDKERLDVEISSERRKVAVVVAVPIKER